MSPAGVELLSALFVCLGVPVGIVGLLSFAIAGAAAIDRTGT